MVNKKRLEKLSTWSTILSFPISILSFLISTYFAILAYNLSKDQADDKTSINILTKLAKENKIQTDTLITLLRVARLQNEQYKNHLQLVQKNNNLQNEISFADGIDFYIKFLKKANLEKIKGVDRTQKTQYLKEMISVLREGVTNSYWIQKPNFNDCITSLIFYLESYISALNEDINYKKEYSINGKQSIIYGKSEDFSNIVELNKQINCMYEIFDNNRITRKRYLESTNIRSGWK